MVLAALVAVVALPSAAWSTGPTNVSGTISANTTWTLANSPYVMTGNVIVASGVTLTIEPGVMVQGNQTSRRLQVDGSLAAVGTGSDHIVFTSSTDSAAGQWYGLYFPTGSGTSTLEYVDVRYGGGGGGSDTNGMVEINGGTVTIENSTFTESLVSGVRTYGGTTGAAATVTIRESMFEHNGFNGALKQGDGLNASSANMTVEDSGFWSNASDGIDYMVSNTYTQPVAQISGSSMWRNSRYGVNIFQDTTAAALGPDGNVAGELVTRSTTWSVWDVSDRDLAADVVLRSSLSVDWRGTYWGQVSFLACGVGSQTGTSAMEGRIRALRRTFRFRAGRSTTPSIFQGQAWCGNDVFLVNEPAPLPLGSFLYPASAGR